MYVHIISTLIYIAATIDLDFPVSCNQLRYKALEKHQIKITLSAQLQVQAAGFI